MCELLATQTFRIHGDNIVECERIVGFIRRAVDLIDLRLRFRSPACVVQTMDFVCEGVPHSWDLELFPGFVKSRHARWTSDVFAPLRANGGFLDETPDAVITRVDGERETILCAVEFCSALQAGNQAWQRSGRAYSAGRTGCPYIYIVDFVKYELDPLTRERRALRFPNAAVPYSYVSFSRLTGNLVAQAYVRAEEFQPEEDTKLYGFDEDIFAEEEIAAYLFRSMRGLSTAEVERSLLRKNTRMVVFLTKGYRINRNFVAADWSHIYRTGEDPVDYAVRTRRFRFHKAISEKSKTGHVGEFAVIVRRYAVGLASKDLPFGVVPAEDRSEFARRVADLYGLGESGRKALMGDGGHLVVCMLKGFKPRGDDNRPDRGALPLIAMLTSERRDILTFLYGPIAGGNYRQLLENPAALAGRNGLWNAFLGISDLVLLDAPVLGEEVERAALLLDNRRHKASVLQSPPQTRLTLPKVADTPLRYQEDDVDTAVHTLFAHLLAGHCFEGMCNPPGGDWSGFSILQGSEEHRWLSLPRVSGFGKRPTTSSRCLASPPRRCSSPSSPRS